MNSNENGNHGDSEDHSEDEDEDDEEDEDESESEIGEERVPTPKNAGKEEEDLDTDQETDRLLGQQYNDDNGYYDSKVRHHFSSVYCQSIRAFAVDVGSYTRPVSSKFQMLYAKIRLCRERYPAYCFLIKIQVF